MKALLDTDILLDVALQRDAFFDDSALVVRWAESVPGHAAMAWHSLSNISYILRPDARPFIRQLLEFIEIAPATVNQARQALDLVLPDFEDALQVAAAIGFGAECIVTRNVAHYRRSPVPALLPRQFLSGK